MLNSIVDWRMAPLTKSSSHPLCLLDSRTLTRSQTLVFVTGPVVSCSVLRNEQK